MIVNFCPLNYMDHRKYTVSGNFGRHGEYS